MVRTREGPADTATRVLAGDDGTNYDAVAIALHWATVALVLIQFALSQTWGWFGRPTHHVMVVAHMSFGILLAAVIIARIAWRLIPGTRCPRSFRAGSGSHRSWSTIFSTPCSRPKPCLASCYVGQAARP